MQHAEMNDPIQDLDAKWVLGRIIVEPVRNGQIVDIQVSDYLPGERRERTERLVTA